MADALSLYLVFGPSIIIYTPLTLLKLLAKGHHQHRTAIKILDHRGLARLMQGFNEVLPASIFLRRYLPLGMCFKILCSNLSSLMSS